MIWRDHNFQNCRQIQLLAKYFFQNFVTSIRDYISNYDLVRSRFLLNIWHIFHKFTPYWVNGHSAVSACPSPPTRGCLDRPTQLIAILLSVFSCVEVYKNKLIWANTCVLNQVWKIFFWNFQKCQAVSCYILVDKQMLEKEFCSNIAPSSSSGNLLFYKAECMGRSCLHQVLGWMVIIGHRPSKSTFGANKQMECTSDLK